MPGSPGVGAGAWRLRSKLAEVDAVDRRLVTMLFGGSGLLRFHSLAALVGAGVDGVLAIMLTLSGQALALGTGEILAHLGAGQARIKASVGSDKLGLLGKGRAGSSKHGNSGDKVFDVHDVLQD
jgi:hypothetical protein